VVFALLCFIPGYACSFILKQMGMLRTPEAAEILGLNPTKVPAQGFPEGILASALPAQ
jgi:hypothetical protein